MRLRKFAALRWLGLLVFALATSCDTEPKIPTRADPITINLNGNAPAVFAFTQHTFTSDRQGIATVTLRWTNGDLDFFATASGCTPNPFFCDTKAFSEASTGNSEVLTFGVVQGEVVRLWVENFAATVGQAYTIEVKIE